MSSRRVIRLYGCRGNAARPYAHRRTRELGTVLDLEPPAWQAPQAWEGLTKVGGGTMPATIAGRAGLNELVIHGWDLARATGQPYNVDEASAQASAEFLSHVSAEPGQPGPFGPAVEVPSDASVLDRAVGLSGRDPDWTGQS